MEPQTRSQLDAFFGAMASASRALLMLDYDGTLAPFHQKRHQASPYPGVADLIQDIMRNRFTRVVVVSGRDTSETIPLLGIHPAPEVWGLHGLQRCSPGGDIATLTVPTEVLEALSDADRWLAYQQLRHTAEYKTGSIAVHWRGLAEHDAEHIRGRVLLGWAPIASCTGLDLLEFDGGVEIRAPEADKGDVVHTLLGESGPGTSAAYLGDDATDEHAFRAIGGNGLSVLVRPRRRHTAAQVWLRPPEELVTFLTEWLRTCEAHGRLGGEAIAAVSR